MNVKEEDMAPAAHDPSKKVKTMMTTADMAMRMDPIYGPISKRFHENPDEVRRCLCPRLVQTDPPRYGPRAGYIGPEVPDRRTALAGQCPGRGSRSGGRCGRRDLKAKIAATGLSVGELVVTAWASASTFRGSDKRGGANGARIRLAPQKDWDVNEPMKLSKALEALEGVQKAFNDAQSGGKKVSLADVIVLAGAAGVEQAAKAAGHDVEVPFTPGRTDASQDQTDVESFSVMEPMADGFRNYQKTDFTVSPEELLVDRAQLLNLSAPEMTALVGGLRVLGANFGDTKHGVFTDRVGVLSTDFFTNLLDMGTEWKPAGNGTYEGRDRASGEIKWTGTRVDLVFGSNSQLRALAEVYGQADAGGKFVCDFVSAWNKVMNADRFDLK